MKFQNSAFACDHCHLSWWDLLKLIFGCVIQDGAVKVAREEILENLDLPRSDGTRL
jgi:hypothetical protein